VESSLSAALEALLETIARLEKVVPGANLNALVTLHAVTPHAQVFETSFGREVSEENPTCDSQLIHLTVMVCKSALCSSLVDGAYFIWIDFSVGIVPADLR
jgi:hypothetical protein